MSKGINFLAWSLVLIGGLISIGLVIRAIADGYLFWRAETNYTVTGQFGDFFGGVVGTIFTIAGTLLIFLTFNEQSKQNKRLTFESAFFEMLRLHRENINELSYTTIENNQKDVSQNRKVFKVIYKEFLECYKEINKFVKIDDIIKQINHNYRKKLKKIILENNLKINMDELVKIDIAYSIIYYGLSEEGEYILKHNFNKKYKRDFYNRILKYLRLKPKKNDIDVWGKWIKLNQKSFHKFKAINEELYNYRNNISDEKLSDDAKYYFFSKKKYFKYYGGHQHRLGHYFRHLFQSYKYLNNYADLTKEQKYFYAKTLRAQLSTYEQSLLFINSVSSLGMKWEYCAEIEDPIKRDKDFYKIITKYNLIKNLPGYHMLGIAYKNYYPNVSFESEEG